MVGELVRSEVAQRLLSDLVWKLHNRVKPISLIYVIQQIESRNAHKTLRSAEREPTLSAHFVRFAGRLLSADCKGDQPFSRWRGVFLIILSFVV
jgi:hypothetical protein